MKTVWLICGLLAFGQFHAQEDTLMHESFEGGLHYNWILRKLDTNTMVTGFETYDSGWILKANPNESGDTILASCSNFDPAGKANRWLISEAITLGASGNVLTWNSRSVDPSYPDAFQVLLSTTGTDSADFTNVLFTQYAEVPVWGETKIDLDAAGFAGQTVNIAFVHNTNDGFILEMDEIMVRSNVLAGIKDLSTSTISVYPNPVKDVLHVSGLNAETITILDLTGKILLATQGQQLDVQALSPGMYVLRATKGEQLYTTRFLHF